jgi:hypothetical protein
MSGLDRGKVCTRCHLYRDWNSYPAHKLTKDGKQSWCRFCKTQGMRILRSARREGGDDEL